MAQTRNSRAQLLSLGKSARLAGLFYLVAGFSGAFSFSHASRLITFGDNAATASAILTSETLFRLGIVGELITPVFLILVAVMLFRIFGAANKTLAILMVAFTIVAAPIQYLNVMNEMTALTLVKGQSGMSALDEEQRHALAMMYLGQHRQGLQLAQVFWGLWLLPVGVIMLKSGIVQRIVGLLLIAAGIGYVASTTAWLFMSEHSGLVNQYKIAAAGLGETSFVAWLLVGRIGTQLGGTPH